MNLQDRIKAALGLTDDQFSSHESDLYVEDDKGMVMTWLAKNYIPWKIVTRFQGQGSMKGHSCLEIPFAHGQFWANRGM